MVLSTRSAILKIWSGNPWESPRSFQGSARSNYLHNTEMLFALFTFILSQVNGGLLQKLQNINLLEKLHLMHSCCCIHSLRQREWSKYENHVIYEARNEIDLQKCKTILFFFLIFLENGVIFNKTVIYAICNRVIILKNELSLKVLFQFLF